MAAADASFRTWIEAISSVLTVTLASDNMPSMTYKGAEDNKLPIPLISISEPAPGAPLLRTVTPGDSPCSDSPNELEETLLASAGLMEATEPVRSFLRTVW